MNDIELAPGVKITADEAVTGTRALLGIRGSGKTTTAVSTTEHIIRAGYVAGVIDPLDVWWGLRSSKDGKGPGLPVYVFGGKHADAPLEPTAGAIMARWLMKARVPVVLSLKHMPHAGQTRFVTDFALEIYRHNDQPLHIVIDEVARFCPQQVRPDMARCVGAIQDLGSEGRASGIGTTVIGQRAARVNKDVLTQAQTLICMQTVSALDRKAISDWIGENGDEEARKQMMRDIAALPIGTGYYYAPREGAPRRVEFFDRTTFDSSATPKVGKPRPAPTVFASVDLESLRGEIEASVEAAKADDPKALRARIAELEKKIVRVDDSTGFKGTAIVADHQVCDEQLGAMERRAIAAEEDWQHALEKRDKLVEVIRDVVQATRACTGVVMSSIEQLTSDVHRISDNLETTPPLERREAPERETVARVSPTPIRPAGGSDEPAKTSIVHDGEKVTPACVRILEALAQRSSKPLGRRALGFLCGQSPKSSSYQNNLAWLNARGYIRRVGDGLIEITSKGVAIAPATEAATTREMHELWLPRFVPAQRRILEVLFKVWPHELDRVTLAERASTSPTSSSYQNNVAAMNSIGVIERMPGGGLKAHDDMFPTGKPR